MSGPTPFRHDTFMESADRFHGRDLLSDPTPRVVVCRSDAPALVLGSVQRSFIVDAGADDPRFADVTGDVGKSMHWMGTRIRVALEHVGVDDVAIHDSPMVCTDWCRLVCFAGIGPGEVVRGDRKLVGISQRRTRIGSRFQCAVHTRWNPELLVSLLVPPRPEAAELRDVATVDDRVARALPDALVAVLNAL